MTQQLSEQLHALLNRVKTSSRTLAQISPVVKNKVLEELAERLHSRQAELLTANAQDLDAYSRSGVANSAFQDRLTLTPTRIQAMAQSLRAVSQLTDPVGEVVDERVLPSGIHAKRVRSPLGVIFMIFESRPNVAIEAFSLGFKSGNAMILRGGKESLHTVQALAKEVHAALASQGLPQDCAWFLENSDRAWVEFLLKQDRVIDLVVPRGGEGLIQYVAANTRIPLIRNDRGMCHTYIHADADLEMAVRIVTNAKTQRPGVCNALETVLVHESVAASVLPKLYDAMKSKNVEWFTCPRALSILASRDGVHPTTPQSFDTEYLDYKINARVVKDLDKALVHIAEHGSKHSEAIVSTDESIARRFQREIDAAAVYWNASTRFTDGFEFGLGGELGISTQKLHVRGPVGLRELASVRWVLDGNGQIRV